jgi:hypothetical protein
MNIPPHRNGGSHTPDTLLRRGGIFREFRNSYSNRKETFIASANTINEKLIKLIEAYESLEKVTERDVLSFHIHLGRIFPFEDGNGRVGRLIMFKECLH